jgi:hypothetical protein
MPALFRGNIFNLWMRRPPEWNTVMPSLFGTVTAPGPAVWRKSRDFLQKPKKPEIFCGKCEFAC